MNNADPQECDGGDRLIRACSKAAGVGERRKVVNP